MKILSLLVCLGSATAVSAQVQEPPNPQIVSISRGGIQVTRVTVPITNTGIGDQTFLNPGNPPDLLRLAGGGAVELVFENRSTRDVTIRVGGDRPALLVPVGESRAIAIGYPPPDEPTPVLRTFDVVADGITIGTGYYALSATPEPRALSAQQQAPSDPSEKRPTAVQSRDPAAVVRTLSMPRTSGQAVADPTAPVPTSEQQFVIPVQLNGTGVDDWNFRNSRNPPYLLKGSPADAPAIRKLGDAFLARLVATRTAAGATIPAVENGINVIAAAFAAAKAAYEKALAEAAPGEIVPPPQNPWDTLALLERTLLEFSNYSIDRTFTVTVDIPEPAEMRTAGIDAVARARAKEEFEKTHQVKLGDCSSAAPTTCKLVLNLPFGAPKTLRVSLFVPRETDDPNLTFLSWYKYLSNSQSPIVISVNFFDENATPAESSAYVSLVPLPALKEPPSKTTWVFSPTISASRDPLVGDTTSLSIDEPFPGDVRRQLAGIGRLQLKQTLGGRADAVVELAFKAGVLGEKDQSGKVSVPTYQVNINSIPGLRLSFGRFLFANPAQGIASKDQGEGFRISFRNKFGVSHIVRRESLDGAPDTSNRDNKLLLFEVNNVAGRTWKSVRGINFLVTLGQDRAPKTLHWYGTAGFDTAFSVPDSPFAGTAAYYYSQRKPRGDQTEPVIVRGSGHVALVTLGYTFFEKTSTKAQVTRKPLASLRMEWGRGRGDDLDTADRDESYLGETASFSPDVFFLSTFASKLKDVGPRNTGLRNKQYFALVYQEERFTLLDIVAKLLQIPPRDVASRLLRAGARGYKFNTNIVTDNEAHDAGYELFAESQIETPAGVRSSLQFACFRPGSAIRPYFKDRSLWSVVAKVTVALGN